jgi:hypothetical protein
MTLNVSSASLGITAAPAKGEIQDLIAKTGLLDYPGNGNPNWQRAQPCEAKADQQWKANTLNRAC